MTRAAQEYVAMRRRVAGIAVACVALSACARGPSSERGASPAGAEAGTAPADGGATAEGGSGGLPLLRTLASGGKVPDPDSSSRRRVVEDDEFWQEKLSTARAEAAAGEDQAALDLLSTALRLRPPAPWDGRMKSLRLEIKARHVDTAVLRVDARGDRDYVPFGEDVVLVLRLRNVGTEDVVVRPPEGSGPDATSGAAFVLSIARRDIDVYAAEMRRSWTQVVPIVTEGTGELRIPPEGSFEVRARVPAGDAGETIAGLHVLEVGGSLRAGRIDVGIGDPLGRIPIRAARVLVLPGNYEPLAADPVGSMRKAVAAGAPVHLLVAAQFVHAEGRPEALSVLASALSEGPSALGAAALNAIRTIRRDAAGTPLRPLVAPFMEALSARPARADDVMEGLVAMTGVSLAPDARLWEDWWRRERAGPGTPVPAEDAPVPRAPRAKAAAR